jgi:hypothetical protein
VRYFAVAAGCALLVACGSEAEQLAQGEAAGYGLTIVVPDGWDGSVSRGAVRLANRSLPSPVLGWRELEPDEVVVEIRERDPSAHPQVEFPAVAGSSELAITGFDPPEPGTYPEQHGVVVRPFSLHGRYFVLFAQAGTRPVSDETVRAVNEALATLTVEPGDFYDDQVEPASFPPGPGWYPGSSGAQPIRPEGEWATSWASTIPYRDEWRDLPPQRTLEALPGDGLVIWLALSRFWDPGVPGQRFPAHDLPYDLSDFERHPGWEGQVRDIPEYRLWTRVPDRYEVDVRVYFGRPDPTPEMLERAQEELNGLRLPDWGPWELRES